MLKRTLLGAVVGLFTIAGVANAVIEVGDAVPSQCWKTVDDSTYCTDEDWGSVRVLLYNAGWCGPCNSEFSELVPKVGKYKDKPVVFISLSSAGWTSGSTPSKQFLTEWKDKFKIPFYTAASPKDAGKKFFDPPLYIPNVAIVDRAGNLAFKAVNPGVDKIFSEVDKLLKRRQE